MAKDHTRIKLVFGAHMNTAINIEPNMAPMYPLAEEHAQAALNVWYQYIKSNSAQCFEELRALAMQGNLCASFMSYYFCYIKPDVKVTEYQQATALVNNYGTSLIPECIHCALYDFFIGRSFNFNYLALQILYSAHPFKTPQAAYRYGYSILHGIGTAKNMAEGVRILDEAAHIGSADACYELGLWYLNGKGVRASKRKAYSFFLTANFLGHPLAAAQITMLPGFAAPKTKVKEIKGKPRGLNRMTLAALACLDEQKDQSLQDYNNYQSLSTKTQSEISKALEQSKVQGPLPAQGNLPAQSDQALLNSIGAAAITDALPANFAEQNTEDETLEQRKARMQAQSLGSNIHATAHGQNAAANGAAQGSSQGAVSQANLNSAANVQAASNAQSSGAALQEGSSSAASAKSSNVSSSPKALEDEGEFDALDEHMSNPMSESLAMLSQPNSALSLNESAAMAGSVAS